MTVTTFTDNFVATAGGAAQTYVVPVGVNYIKATCVGASGGNYVNHGASIHGGNGATVVSAHQVTPGETLTIWTGHRPLSINETGEGSAAYSPMGGGGTDQGNVPAGFGNKGGGSSDIRQGGTALANRIVVAGGGGAAGSNDTGSVSYNGGDATLGNQDNAFATGTGGPYGGTQARLFSGGAGGQSRGTATEFSAAGHIGALGNGGQMRVGNTWASGGGGGGYYGGGSGAEWENGAGNRYAYPGGGGSSRVTVGALISTTVVQQTGTNGLTGSVAIDTVYTPTTPTVTIPPAGSAVSAARFGFVVDIRELHPAATGIKSITYQVSKDSTFATGVIAKTVAFSVGTTDGAIASDPSLSVAATGTQMGFWVALTSQGTWYYRVMTSGDQSLPSSAWTATASFISAHIPGVTIVSPTGGNFSQWASSIGFKFTPTDPWSRDTVSAYQLIVEDNAAGTTILDSGKQPFVVQPAFVLTTVNVALSSTLKDTLLRWKVRVWDSTDVASTYSDYSTFYLVDPPSVAITAPADGGVVTSGAPTFTWTVGETSGRTPSTTVITVRDQATNSTIWSKTVNGAVYSATPDSTVLVNQIGYSVEVDVTDTAGLIGTDINLFSTSYVSPDPIQYTVDASNINVDGYGYVEINWQNQAPDSRLASWQVYRRVLPNTQWTMIAQITDSNVKLYRDYLVQAGLSYMYTVTQLADRSGALLESPIGTRGLPPFVASRTNLVTNPSAEVSSGTTWSVGGSSTGVVLSYNTTAPYLGTQNYQAVVDGSAASQGIAVNITDARNQVPVSGRLALKSSVAASQVDVWMRVLYSDTSNLDGAKTTYSVGTVWAEYTALPVTGSGAKTVTGYQLMARTKVAAAMTLSADTALIEEAVTVGTYFDGSYGAPNGYSVSWMGGVNASTSQLVQVPSQAESQINYMDITNYWIIDPDDPTLSMLIPQVINNAETEEYDTADYNIVGRGRHRDYGDRLGYTGELKSQVRVVERVSTLRAKAEALRAAQKTYYLRTPFGRLFTVALGNIGWDPKTGVGTSDMGDMTIPYVEVG